jgi:thiamine biosynthesis protein ThiS
MVRAPSGGVLMQIRVNGEDQEVADGTTVAGLLERLQIRPERVAVERNRLVVKRATWLQAKLEAGDEIEILTFVGGG